MYLKNLGKIKLVLLTPHRQNAKSVYTLFENVKKVGVYFGITVTNENGYYEEINYLLLHLSVQTTQVISLSFRILVL